MLKYHWMHRGMQLSPKQMSELVTQKNNAGYESILFTYKDFQPDYFLKAAGTINPEEKIKYMFAVRPYTVSAHYLAMMAQAFHEICPDRLILNIVSGETNGEGDPDPCFDVDIDISSPKGRLDYVPGWLDKFVNCKTLVNKPEIIVSTKNNLLIEKTKHNTDKILCMYDDYLDYQDQYLLNYKKIMVSGHLVLMDTDEKAEYLAEEISKGSPKLKKRQFYGTIDTVKKKILNMATEGITDVLFNTYGLAQEKSVHAGKTIMVKKAIEYPEFDKLILDLTSEQKAF